MALAAADGGSCCAVVDDLLGEIPEDDDGVVEQSGGTSMLPPDVTFPTRAVSDCSSTATAAEQAETSSSYSFCTSHSPSSTPSPRDDDEPQRCRKSVRFAQAPEDGDGGGDDLQGSSVHSAISEVLVEYFDGSPSSSSSCGAAGAKSSTAGHITEEELRAAWYSPEEYRDIRERCASQIEREEEMASSSSSSSSDEGDDHHQQEAKEGARQHRTIHPVAAPPAGLPPEEEDSTADDTTFRGLECQTRKGSWQRFVVQDLSRNAVLQEQERQDRNYICDDDLIAGIYRRYSASSVRKAVERAKADEVEAREYLTQVPAAPSAEPSLHLRRQRASQPAQGGEVDPQPQPGSEGGGIVSCCSDRSGGTGSGAAVDQMEEDGVDEAVVSAASSSSSSSPSPFSHPPHVQFDNHQTTTAPQAPSSMYDDGSNKRQRIRRTAHPQHLVVVPSS